MRTLFFGTPDYAVPSLRALAQISEVMGVVCQPDKPKGRGMVLQPPPVKECAVELGIPVVQPTKLRNGEFAAWVRAQQVELAVVIAYGRILPKEVLDAPRLGCVNLHASLLPKYRGAAPITWAVVDGETETGVCLMRMDEGLDTGDVLEVARTGIAPNETSGALYMRLSEMSAELVRVEVPRYAAGALQGTPQDNRLATHARMLKKEDGRISWTAGASRVHNHVRGMSPWPGAWTTLHGQTIKVHAARIVSLASQPGVPGTVVLADKSGVLVLTGAGLVSLDTVQCEGKKPLRAADWVNGRGVNMGDVFA